ncbi:MAG: taurine dioxygenase [Rhodospirillaceae bacterium]|jgi:taurine dioxygenase|nr:taurine dioxygenase [Rhodospirillaceae bacterium]MBT5664603.1 taurine dioxygenase [Rhodospirillaceae bacterium]
MSIPNLDIRPIAGALGAEIHGVNLAKDLDDDMFAAIHQTMLDHCVIMFRDQDISPQAQIDFAKRWGKLHKHPFMPGLKGHPELLEIVKKEDDVHTLGGDWHTDQMFTAVPALATMLYAKETPPAGGDTLFSNMYMAYDALSDAMKAMLADARTVNIYTKNKGRAAAMKNDYSDGEPEEYVHPLFRTHPETGRKTLYLSYKGVTRRIAGLSDEESGPILDFLMKHATRPEFTCRFAWEPGSLGIWDNRSVMHLAVNDYHGFRRVMHRLTIEGQPIKAA